MSNIALYPAYIEIDSNESGSGWFKDVPGCIFAGDTLAGIFEDAQQALIAHFESLADSGQEIPLPTQGITPEPDTVIIAVSIDLEKFEGSAERINITLPKLLISKIDFEVSQNSKYESRSGFIAMACRNLLAEESK